MTEDGVGEVSGRKWELLSAALTRTDVHTWTPTLVLQLSGGEQCFRMKVTVSVGSTPAATHLSRVGLLCCPLTRPSVLRGRGLGHLEVQRPLIHPLCHTGGWLGVGLTDSVSSDYTLALP